MENSDEGQVFMTEDILVYEIYLSVNLNENEMNLILILNFLLSQYSKKIYVVLRDFHDIKHLRCN